MNNSSKMKIVHVDKKTFWKVLRQEIKAGRAKRMKFKDFFWTLFEIFKTDSKETINHDN